ncbi:MAG: crossover junction endodeoxyribonuclease RuvC [Deltaproteobacteria bacterium]|nr:crossover junction endodeoxyribonuclease RuvC [Deltaproteobacteria bacterium]
MIILGIDPGSHVTGYGVIAVQGQKMKHIDNGGIITSPKIQLSDRLHHIYTQVSQIIQKYGPEVLALEDIFMAKNARSAMILGHARGAIMIAAKQANLPIEEYTARQVKQAVVGHGNAAKEQIQHMTRALLSLPEIAMEDAADALAVAICHSQSYALKKRLKGTL